MSQETYTYNQVPNFRELLSEHFNILELKILFDDLESKLDIGLDFDNVTDQTKDGVSLYLVRFLHRQALPDKEKLIFLSLLRQERKFVFWDTSFAREFRVVVPKNIDVYASNISSVGKGPQSKPQALGGKLIQDSIPTLWLWVGGGLLALGILFIGYNLLPPDKPTIEPSAAMDSPTITETATSTPIPPTETATPTPIPPTETATLTPIPPTETATLTPIPPTDTATLTPIPPMDTTTPTPLLPTETATPTELPEVLSTLDPDGEDQIFYQVVVKNFAQVYAGPSSENVVLRNIQKNEVYSLLTTVRGNAFFSIWFEETNSFGWVSADDVSIDPRIDLSQIALDPQYHGAEHGPTPTAGPVATVTPNPDLGTATPVVGVTPSASPPNPACHVIEVVKELSEIKFKVNRPNPNVDFYRLSIVGNTGKSVIDFEKVEKSSLESGASYSVPNTKFSDEDSLKGTESTVTIEAYDGDGDLICRRSEVFVRNN